MGSLWLEDQTYIINNVMFSHFFQSLLDLHKTADEASDPQLTDFIEGNFLEEQVEAIKEFGDLVTRMRRVGEGVGIHLIDKELDS